MDGRRTIQSPLRLLKVPGFGTRTSDLIYRHPQKPGKSVVIFFGGDVQDFSENMNSHRDNKNYVKWNLENTTLLLGKKFPESHVIVIKPSRMEWKTFSCYENFVPCKANGVPDHSPMHSGLEHLQNLLQNLSEKLQNIDEKEMIECFEISKNALFIDDELITTQDLTTSTCCNIEHLNLTEINLKLIGFSKGCVVLNQFLHEFHYIKNNVSSNQLKIIKKITDMYWLDGGHSGGKNTWITSKPLLETFVSLGINVHVHVTPYQIEDDRRPWIKKEEKLFCDTLRKLGASLERQVHFDNLQASLSVHFNLLREF